MLTVDVDRNEFSRGLAGLLSRMPDVTVRAANLEAADYAIGRNVGIERKTRGDFVQSIIDKRLFEQVARVRSRYSRPLLVIEGLVPGYQACGLTWPKLRGALLSVSTMFGVPVIHSTGPAETAETIRTIGLQLASPGATHGYVRPGYHASGWRRRALYVLQGLPGVGPTRAAALLDRFKSVQGVVNATEEQLWAVRGIGAAVAAAIRASIGTDPATSLH